MATPLVVWLFMTSYSWGVRPFPRSQVLEMIRTGQCGLFNPRLLDSPLVVWLFMTSYSWGVRGPGLVSTESGMVILPTSWSNPRLLDSFLAAEDQLFTLYQNLPDAQGL